MAADVVGGGVDEDRVDLMMRDLPLQAIDQLLLRQPALIEESLHERVVAFSHLFDELLPPIVRVALQRGGDVDRVELPRTIRGVLVGLHAHQVDDSFEIFLFADGKLDGHHILAKLFLQGLQGAGERGPFAVHLVDDDHPRQREFIGELPDLLRRHFHAGDAAHHHGCRIGDAHGASRLHQEDAEAGRVQQIDLGVVPLDEGGRRGDRMLPFDLVLIEIRRGGAVVDAAQPGGGAGVEQELGNEAGLARVVMADQSHVPDFRAQIDLHG